MDKSNQPTVLKNWVRWLLIIAGTVCVGLGILGIFLPVLPTTPFLLLAAVCYARSSQRLYHWLLNNRWFGRYISNYLQGKGIPLKLKIWTICLLWIAILSSIIFAVELLAVRILLAVIAVGVTTHLLMVPTLKE